jgi:hypothetical protein
MAKFGPQTLAFLAALRVCPSITKAAKAAGITREAHYRRLERDPDYKPAFEQAYREGIDSLEDEAVRRATGMQRPVLYHGQPVFTREDPNDPESKLVPVMDVEYSDTLLLALLKAKKPELYKERVEQEISGKGGEPVGLQVVFVDPPERE